MTEAFGKIDVAISLMKEALIGRELSENVPVCLAAALP